MKRRVAREKALQALFQIDMSGIKLGQAIKNVLEEDDGDDFLTDLVTGVKKNETRIDKLISDNLENWTIDRLANVDRIILRIATYELLERSDVPKNVVLDEAIEISKAFSDEESSKFINAVLSKIKKTLEAN